MSYELLRESFSNGPSIDKDGYRYYINSICDGIPPISPEILEEAVDGLLKICKFDCDHIMAPESMGIPLATALSLKTRIPFGIIRKRAYGLPGEITVQQTTGYSSGQLFINGINPGDRVVIVDDLVSTGGTLRALVAALQKHGIEVTEVGVVFSKAEDISEVLPGINAKVLIRI